MAAQGSQPLLLDFIICPDNLTVFDGNLKVEVSILCLKFNVVDGNTVIAVLLGLNMIGAGLWHSGVIQRNGERFLGADALWG